jgi:hypothetical protein
LVIVGLILGLIGALVLGAFALIAFVALHPVTMRHNR